MTEQAHAPPDHTAGALPPLADSSQGAPVFMSSEELNAVDYIADNEPSCFLRCTMSRRISESLVTRERLHPFLVELLGDARADGTAVRGIYYGKSARRVILIHVSAPTIATQLLEQLHEKPCALINQRVMYVEYAMHRKEKEARDAFMRVASISRIRSLEDPSQRIPGLVLLPEFVTRDQEALLLEQFDADDRRQWKNTVKARQVQHYGFEFNYETRRCDESQPLGEQMPESLVHLIEMIPPNIMDKPDQITVNEYQPGQGIAAHIDTHSAFTNAIASLSLGHEIVMEFRHPDGRVESVLLQPRSLLVMTGASRYEWTHAIPPRLFDVIDGQRVDRQRRVSITFRKVQSRPCACEFPVQCDVQEKEKEQQRLMEQQRIKQTEEQQQRDHGDTSLAPTLVEQQYVHQFYETVASHFSSTRYNPWPRVAAFVRSLAPGSWIADIGCGNGKYMKCVDATQSLAVGGDRSSKLVEICQQRGLNTMVCDALTVPIRSQCCDAALSIAVLHHLSTLHHRLVAVKEVIRVLRVGGRGVIYAWAHEQKANSKRQFDAATQDFMVPWNLDKRFAPKTNEGEPSEASEEKRVVQRYCHMFKQGELEELVQMAGHAVAEESYYDESNWAVVLRRVD